ncbi:Fur family transcriptional regulator [Nocardioides sp. Kera G14]|uniref:Fur family transcriptional regulator n=1 Tax=Nocardioides sp. Kera G14 TaxID=2884264 RepID=UPI001D10FEE9|nr:Fur family transcriptional regulator [Nocardioides sp. Kera G14]UDY24497.1 transcriptional repressor [Nocardioides sp. Kera G14]
MTTSPERRRSTTQGDAVKDALLGQDGFRSAQDVYADLRAGGQKIGLSTVYRHLQAFTDHGLVDVIHNADGETTYRYCGDSAAGHHHHHLVCRRCGRAEEVEGRAVERWADEIAKKFGYADVDHTIEVFGTCPDCAAATQP